MSNFPATTTIDVAYWFLKMARKEDFYLQPLMLHRLLFVAQGLWSMQNGGKELMPAIFVARKEGPIEPNLWRVLEEGYIPLEERALSKEVVLFLDKIWRKFSHHRTDFMGQRLLSSDWLNKACKEAKEIHISKQEILEIFSLKRPTKDEIITADGRHLRRWQPKKVTLDSNSNRILNPESNITTKKSPIKQQTKGSSALFAKPSKAKLGKTTPNPQQVKSEKNVKNDARKNEAREIDKLAKDLMHLQRNKNT